MTDPVIRPIPLSQLELSPENVRKTPASGSALAELTASIAAHGLIGSLVVQSGAPGPNGAGRYPVIAGGRRLAALNALVRDGTSSNPTTSCPAASSTTRPSPASSHSPRTW